MIITYYYLPIITKRRHHTKTTEWRRGRDAYQTLPESLPVLQKPLVVLVWSTILYQASDLGLILLPATFTNHYRRGEDITHSDWTMCYAGL